jgi:N-sulfoglucosamine sulfohydrolase
MFSRSSSRVDRVGIHEYIATLPEILEANGFHTAITQKFHMSPPWKFPYSSRDPVHNDPAGFKAAMERFITEAGDRPFFIQANISPPHRPFHHHMEQFPDFLADTAAIAVFPFLPDVPEVRLDLQQYFGSVQLADACAGALIEVLREQNLLEQTLVIFTGDQGAPFHRAKASAYYAGLHVPFVISGPDIKKDHTSAAMISLIDIMPTILDYLDMPIPETVQGASILPIARGEKEGITGRKYLFGEHNSHGPNRKEHYPTRIVFDGRFYYMQNLMPEKDYLLPDDLAKKKGWGNLSYEATLSAAEQYPLPYALLKELESGRPPVELYDLQEDPAQLNNLAGSPKYIRQEEELRLVLKEWRKTTGDFANDPLQIPTRLKEAVNN